MPYNITKKVIEGITEKESNAKWNNLTPYRQSKFFLKSFDKKKTKQVMLQSRTTIALVAGISTGHCLLNRHLAIIRIVEDPSECGKVETSFHFIAECLMYALVRWRLQG
ncbi:jg16826 [Pararge aegeria aegeria]|uniref:Jg16826 protein n=1 Tax=Pararge aegeria aegeria TaxID=348720 RepID=A0A8S4SLW9_9NEOP|nr:jg16826 [Pararge aegeria aegeria]